MSIADLSQIFSIIKGGEPSDEERANLFKETLLMTLARASDADSNVSPVEVETVQTIVQRVTGEAVSAGDIRVAAASELYETGPLEQHLSRVGGRIDAAQRVTIVESLAEVIKSDVQITSREVNFFNMVADALNVTPAELVGLYS